MHEAAHQARPRCRRLGGGAAPPGVRLERRRPERGGGVGTRRGIAPARSCAVPIEGREGLLGVLNVTDPVSQQDVRRRGLPPAAATSPSGSRSAWQRGPVAGGEPAPASKARRPRSAQLLQHVERGRRTAPDRVRLARATAREMRLPEAEVGVIGFAATVHDVGMTVVGEDVVDRGGALTAGGARADRAPPGAGRRAARPAGGGGRGARGGAVRTTRWWDGIGLSARGSQGRTSRSAHAVLAVVDAYESMTMGRAHRARDVARARR